MINVQEIAQKIIEEKDNLIAKAFTMQIGRLLMDNGIVPVMREYTKNDIDNITNPNEYKLVTEYGCYFNKLDTTEHDKKVRAKVIDEFRYELELLPLDDRELIKYAIADEHSFNEYVDWVAEELKGQNK